MKKMTLLNATTLFLVVLFLSASVFQCKKEGDFVKDLDRSFKGKADSALYAAFYESNTISTADVTPRTNDIMKFRGVQTIVHEYCATSNCHNGPISPKLNTYTEIMQFVTAGDPEGSKLWQFLTTNDFDKAMPPVNSNHEMSATDKALIYNWIKNGAKEKPNLADFRPAAISLITTGCASSNCHSQATATGAWARSGYFVPNPFASLVKGTDTTEWIFTDQVSGVKSSRCMLSNETKRSTVWTAYKDSVKKWYADTINNISFKPWKTYSTRGPLNSYDDIIMDIMYPKSTRTKNNYLDSKSTVVYQIDTTVLMANPYSGVYGTTVGGGMAYNDGGLKPSEVALIKAWYFADPTIPDVWKYGKNNVGMFKYTGTNTIIIKK